MKTPPLFVKFVLVLASWSLLTPIFGGYFNGFLLLCWILASWVHGVIKSQKLFPSRVDHVDIMSSVAKPIHLGIAVFLGAHVLTSISGYFLSPFARPLVKVVTEDVHLVVKWALLWAVFYQSMVYVVRRQWDPANIGPWMVFGMFVHFVYCLAQRRWGIDWTHGIGAQLGNHRFAYGVYRISGWHSHPLTLACNLMLIVASSACLSLKLDRGLTARNRYVWMAISGIGLATLLFSGSRFVLLVFPMAFIFLEWRLLRRYIWHVSAVLAFFLVVLWLEGSIKGRFLELFDSSVPIETRFSRLAYWRVHLRIFLDHPWIGMTMAGSGEALKSYWPPEYQNIEILPAHNIILQTLADSGILGGIGLAGFVVGFMVAAKRARLILGHASGLEWLLLLTLLSGLVQNNLRDSEYLMALWYLTSLLIGRLGATSLGQSSTSGRI